MPNLAEVAIQNMYTVLKVAAVLFVFKLGLSLFGYSRVAFYLEMFALAALTLLLISAVGGYMSVADSISKGVWPQ